MSAVRDCLLAFVAFLGLLVFALAWFWFERTGNRQWDLVAGTGLFTFAASCGLAWRYRS